MLDNNESKALEIGLAVLHALVVAVPDIADWLRDLTSGSTHPISVQVRDILPEESESRAAQRELE